MRLHVMVLGWVEYVMLHDVVSVGTGKTISESSVVFKSINQSINEVTDAGTEVTLYLYLKYKHNF